MALYEFENERRPRQHRSASREGCYIYLVIAPVLFKYLKLDLHIGNPAHDMYNKAMYYSEYRYLQLIITGSYTSTSIRYALRIFHSVLKSQIHDEAGYCLVSLTPILTHPNNKQTNKQPCCLRNSLILNLLRYITLSTIISLPSLLELQLLVSLPLFHFLLADPSLRLLVQLN